MNQTMPLQLRINNVAQVTNHLRQQNLDTQDQQTLWLAVIFSLLIHLSFYYLLPYIKSQPTLPNLRIEINMSGAMQTPSSTATAQPTPVAETPPTPEPIRTPAKAPTKTPLKTASVLATEAPTAADDYVMSNNAAPETTNTTEPTSTNSNPSAASNNTQATSSQSNSSANTATESTASEATIEEAWDGYGQALYDAVSKYKNYPPIAVRRNWEGQTKAKARFVLGKLVEIELVDSSGHQVLDSEAIAMIRKAIMQMPVKGNLARQSFTVTVPVSFRLDK